MKFLSKEQFSNQAFTHYLRTGEIHYYEDYLQWLFLQRNKIERKSLGSEKCQWVGGECITCSNMEGEVFKIDSAPIPMHENCKCSCVHISCARITSPYKPRYHPVTGKLENHSGVDIGAPAGTAIKSPIAGTVVNDPSKKSDTYGYWVQVKLADGSIAEFGHLQSPSHLQQGKLVKVGNVIGNVGATGKNVTGPHLHYTRRPASGIGHFKPPQHEIEKLLEDLNEECSKL